MRRLVFTACAVLFATAASGAEESYLPNNAATPGVVNHKVKAGTIKQTICRPSWVKSAQPSARTLASQKSRLVKHARYGADVAKNFDVDHRIPIEVGGDARDPKNLWLQPLNIQWNALVKNKLETYVQTEVCAGRMKLADGQAIFQRDWVDVFRLYCGPDPVLPAIRRVHPACRLKIRRRSRRRGRVLLCGFPA